MPGSIGEQIVQKALEIIKGDVPPGMIPVLMS
jgi:hypothetical protein